MTGFDSKKAAAQAKLDDGDALTIVYLSGHYDGKKAAQRKPLTDEQIWNAIRPLTKSDEVCKSLIDVSMDEYRAIEAAHGIKENT